MIQQMAAVCPACDSVFQFDPAASANAKAKRRKVKQPSKLQLTEMPSRFEMAFRTNFRLDKNESFQASAVTSLAFTFFTALVLNEALTDGMTPLIPLGFALFTAAMYYWLALIAFNKTHIELDEDQITVSRRPLPYLRPAETINRTGVESIHYGETPVSIRENYDTPRFDVWAEMADGHRKTIVSDVVEDYAVFITQQLNEQLDEVSEQDVSRLVEPASHEEPDPATSLFASRTEYRQQ